jgi:hypothetical protein
MLPFEPSSAIKSITACATRRASITSPACILANIAADITPKMLMGSSAESNRAISSEASRAES